MRFVEFSLFSKGVDGECKFYSQKLEMTSVLQSKLKAICASPKFVIMTPCFAILICLVIPTYIPL